MSAAPQRYAGLSAEQAQAARTIARALEQGRAGAAERDALALLARGPEHAEILLLFGLIEQRRGRHAQALQALQRAHALRPDDARIHNALAGTYEAVNDTKSARAALRRACELDAQFAPAWFNYGWRLFVDGDIDAALPVLERAVALAPEDAQARSLLADALNADGQPQLALAQYRQIIAAHPYGAGSAWWGLAMLKPMPLTEADIASMQCLLQDPRCVEHDRVTIGFALALALEHYGDFAQAFATLQRSHARAARSETWDARAAAGRVDEILAAFATKPATAGNRQGEGVIFIVSLPRSGSTLTEQILAAHSQVEGGAELPQLGQVILGEAQRAGQPFAQWARTHTSAQWQALGASYLAQTARWRERRPRFTDKMPGNWMYVGAILTMLPAARVVVCRRDPLETCLACYRQMFRRHPYTHTFADLAARWRDFDRAVRHWQALYPDRVRVQVYEELVGEPEAQIRELLEFCGLPFEEACLNFHTSERRVTTPSAAQVREPIRRDTARSGKYGALLDPLREALGMPRFQGS